MNLDLKNRTQKPKYDDYIGPTRTKATWKPRVTDTPLTFLRCEHCGRVFLQQDSATPIENPGKGRDRISVLPFEPPTGPVTCCGEPMQPVPQVEWADVRDRIDLEHETLGGVNSNAMRIHWEVIEEGCVPRWVCIKTFTGHQTKYITPDKKSPLTFAYADEDAFGYCHDNPCRECVFRCKSGFEIYVYVENIGIVHEDMERILTQKMMGNK
jgi:hypothetical protein